MNIVAGLLYFVAFLPYIWSIVNGQTVPSPVSWVIWTSVDTLTLVAMIKEKAKVGQLIGAVVGAWVVTVLAFIFGKSIMGSIEWVSIAGAIAGIILWQRTGNAVFAIICSQVAVLIGAVPTVVAAYRNPAQEDPTAWLIWTISCVCALFAIKKWNLANALQPLTFTAVEVSMVFLLVIRPCLS